MKRKVNRLLVASGVFVCDAFSYSTVLVDTTRRGFMVSYGAIQTQTPNSKTKPVGALLCRSFRSGSMSISSIFVLRSTCVVALRGTTGTNERRLWPAFHVTVLIVLVFEDGQEPIRGILVVCVRVEILPGAYDFYF